MALCPHPALALRDATPFSTLYGDVYKSREGAFAEAEQVFVLPSEVARRWRDQESCCVLEVGFGLGVNFLRTLQAWRDDAHRSERLFYVSVECAPLRREDLRTALASLDAPAELAQALIEQWPPPLPGLHRLSFCDGRVLLQIALGEAQRMLPRLSLAADAIYLDGFAPSRNADAWSEPVIRALARSARPGTKLVTYTAAASVRRTLERVGFQVSLQPGFAGKRHRIEARWQPAWRSYPPPVDRPSWPERHALVIGAGLAGSACAAALTRRGWRVTVLEQRDRIAGGGSCQPICAEHPHLSGDDNPRARLTRAALLLARSFWPAGLRQEIGALWLDPAADPPQAAGRAAALERLGFPIEFVEPVDAVRASAIAGVTLGRGGLWLPMCAATTPALLCREWLSHASISLRFGQTVDSLERMPDGWIARDPSGSVLARAPVVLLCNAEQAHRLAPVPRLTLSATLGQTNRLEAHGPAAKLRCILSDDGYLLPLVREDAGHLQAGSTYRPWPADDRLEACADVNAEGGAEADDRRNLRRAADLLGLCPDSPGPRADSIRDLGHARGLRWSTSDRLPLVGAALDPAQCDARAVELARNDRLPLPRLPGLFQAFGFGSRGLLWSVLAGEELGARIAGDPAPIETDLSQAIDPGRFLRRALRRGEVS